MSGFICEGKLAFNMEATFKYNLLLFLGEKAPLEMAKEIHRFIHGQKVLK